MNRPNSIGITLFLAIVFFVTSTRTSGQSNSQRPEELIRLIRESPYDTTKIRHLMTLASYYYDTEWNYSNKQKVDSAWQYLVEARKMADSLKAFALRERIWINMGDYFFRCDNIQTAEHYYWLAMAAARDKKDKVSEARLWLEFGGRSPLIDSLLPRIAVRYDSAYLLYKVLKDIRGQANALQGKAYIHYRSGKLELATNELLQAIDLQKKYAVGGLHYAYHLLSHVHALQGNYNIAIQYELDAVREMKKTQDFLWEEKLYAALGDYYGEINQSVKSIGWYEEGLKVIQTKIGSASFQVNNNEGKNGLHEITRKIIRQKILAGHKNVLPFLEDILKTHPPNTDFGRHIRDGALADCYFSQKNYRKAEQYYLSAIRGETNTGQVAELRKEYANISRLYVSTGQYDKAKVYLDKLLAEPNNVIGLALLSEVYKNLYKIDSSSNNYPGALRHFQQYKALNDSILAEKKMRQVEELHLQYQMQKKENDLVLLRKEATLHKNEIERATLTRNIIIIGFISVLVVLAILYTSFRSKQKSNQILQSQQLEIHSKNEALENLVEEKEWLLKEVHHRVKNNLATIVSLLNSQAAYLDNEKAILAIRDSQHRVQAMSIIHQKLYGAENVAVIDMARYIHELTDYLKSSFNVRRQIRFEIEIEPTVLNVSQAVPVGLILNEAITNAIKHAFPDGSTGTIVISAFRDQKGFFELSIKDDGIGFVMPAQRQEAHSLGMSLMHGLSEDIGAICKITGENGTTVSLYLKTEA